MKRRKVHTPLLLLVMVTLVCSQFGLSQTRRRAPATKPSPGPKSEADSGPSLQETLEFIKGKIASSNPGWATDSSKYKFYWKWEWHYKVLRSEGSILEWEWQEIWTAHQDDYTNVNETTQVIKVNLKDISLSSIKVRNYVPTTDKPKPDECCFSVGMQTYNSEKKIIWRQISKTTKRTGNNPRNTADNDEKREEIAGTSLLFFDEETANRVAKALTHAVTLAGGKKEPF